MNGGAGVTQVTLHTVPRKAAFDDLQVGQWVAWIRSDEDADIGRIDSKDQKAAALSSGPHIWPVDCDKGRVYILEDAPAPPVTVRREDYDALVQTVQDNGRGITTAALALIANADLGDSP